MAKDSKTAKQSKDKKKMNPNSVEQNVPVDPSKITGVVKRKVKNPFDGTMIVREGSYELPAAHGDDIATALALVGNKESEVIFWFNQGRKNQARLQVQQALDFDLGSDDLNELYDSFNDAMDSLLTKDATKEKRERIQNFILSEDKFQILKIALDDLKEKGIGGISMVFGSPDADGKVSEGEIELKKPTGVRGRRKKVSEDETETEE